MMDEQTVAGTETEPNAGPASLEDALGDDGELIEEIETSLIDSPAEPVTHMELDDLSGTESGATMRDLDLLADVEVEVAVEFGRTRLALRELLSLRKGSLVELARRPEQKVTVLANGTAIAFGDIVVVGEQLGVHIVELVEPKEVDGTDTPSPTVVVEDPTVDVADGPAEESAEDAGE